MAINGRDPANISSRSRLRRASLLSLPLIRGLSARAADVPHGQARRSGGRAAPHRPTARHLGIAPFDRIRYRHHDAEMKAEYAVTVTQGSPLTRFSVLPRSSRVVADRLPAWVLAVRVGLLSLLGDAFDVAAKPQRLELTGKRPFCL
jgi:hypothetical protein